MFTAVNNIEPFALPILFADLQTDPNAPMRQLRPWYVDILGRFFPTLDAMLARQSWIAGPMFTVADIILTGVLRELRKTEILAQYVHLEQYRHRCEQRPAFVKVLDAYEDRLGIARGSAR